MATAHGIESVGTRPGVDHAVAGLRVLWVNTLAGVFTKAMGSWVIPKRQGKLRLNGESKMGGCGFFDYGGGSARNSASMLRIGGVKRHTSYHAPVPSSFCPNFKSGAGKIALCPAPQPSTD